MSEEINALLADERKLEDDAFGLETVLTDLVLKLCPANGYVYVDFFDGMVEKDDVMHPVYVFTIELYSHVDDESRATDLIVFQTCLCKYLEEYGWLALHGIRTHEEEKQRYPCDYIMLCNRMRFYLKMDIANANMMMRFQMEYAERIKQSVASVLKQHMLKEDLKDQTESCSLEE